MKISDQVDVAIVGAGIIGLAHAFLAARAGHSVAVFERDPGARGASIRNFGMVWPIGQPAGSRHEMALRSRELWLQLLNEIELPYFNTGSLHVAYTEEEAAVAREFGRKAPTLGYDCAWISRDETLERTAALNNHGLLGALWSPTELVVDPRQIIRELPRFLSERYRVQFHFNKAVQGVESGWLQTANGRYEAKFIIVAGGDDFQTLFPEFFEQSSVTRCKLQMMRTVAQPMHWRLGPSLAFGLTFLHYPTFQVCESLSVLRERVERETPAYCKNGIHVMVSQTPAGELTIGDSHEYGLSVNIFDSPAVHQLIFDFAKARLQVPTLEIGEQWHGVYAKHPQYPWLRSAPKENVRTITVTSGIGMTMSFGLAEETLAEMGVSL